MLPSSSGTRPISTPPNVAATKSSSLPESSVTIQGATVVYPVGAAFMRWSPLAW
jgi:hypothetical protein